MPTIAVDVTQDDIRRGKCDYHTCPVARAMKRAGVRLPWVNMDWLRAQRQDCLGNEKICDTPARLKKWIERFDLKGRDAVHPIRFRLRVPSRLLRKQTNRK